MLKKYNHDLQQKCVAILKECWGAFYVDCYESYKSLNVIHGKHVNEFIQDLIPETVKFLNEHVENTKVTRNLITLVTEWRELSRIISITMFENDEEYLNTVKLFKTSVKNFKKAAIHTIFAATSGDDDFDSKKENLYCHVLTEYLLPILKKTYNDYGLGLGIFSMQGMERINKESNTCC